MRSLVIIGSGGHAGVVIDAVRRAGRYEIIGLLDDFIPAGNTKHDCEIIGSVALFEKWIYADFFIAVGDITGRYNVWKILVASDARFAKVIHPASNVCGRVGHGTLICSGATVGPNSTVMDFAIMNTNASLDHDSILGSFSHMAPGSHTGGRVTIGSQTFIGIGASIRDGIKICDNCVIGMGSNVLENVPHAVTGWGNPFKIHA